MTLKQRAEGRIPLQTLQNVKYHLINGKLPKINKWLPIYFPEVTFYLRGILNGNFKNICQIVITSATATVFGKNKPAASTSPRQLMSWLLAQMLTTYFKKTE